MPDHRVLLRVFLTNSIFVNHLEDAFIKGIMEQEDLEEVWGIIETRLQHYQQLDPGNIHGENERFF